MINLRIRHFCDESREAGKRWMGKGIGLERRKKKVGLQVSDEVTVYVYFFIIPYFFSE